MFWVNGQPSEAISLTDRSFQYGDGCFTTMLTREGRIENWSAHQSRMERCLTLLNIDQPNWNQVQDWLKKAALTSPKGGLRLNITRGEGGRGYSCYGVSNINIVISHFAYPAQYKTWGEHGIELGVCHYQLGLNPHLAGHKHNNRLEQILAKQDIDSQGFFDGIVTDLQGHIVETTMANIFWIKEGSLYTPSLTNSGVAGVVREALLKKAKEKQLPINMGSFKLPALLNAEEVFITNSICEIVPVTKIKDKLFPVGPATREFQENYSS
ncbi:aminodeoxychorismate lyase [Vibrio sp. ZSDE26]|uniref:Aminodeoxychorismate lyase n=1 Tax=Vibrio amylolyticus TaxID=2847292 RepID=A0A9X1XFN4_9VIBR|nr:aminodeoxychorismate lyase [Vibrio amylolyticus]MCK6262094.1 aminodeoxychorismate lyase [Vibrio amylolyticus]